MNKLKKKFSRAASKSIAIIGKSYFTSEPPFKEESEKIAFFLLGKLSTSFAEMEQGVQNLLSSLVMKDNFIANYLIEKNTLDLNLTLIQKTNELIEFKPDEILELIGLIREVKEERNTLIHGSWFVVPGRNEEEIFITVTTNKIKLNTDEKGRHKTWESVTEKEFSIATIKDLILKVHNINVKLEDTISDLKAAKEE